MKLLTATLLTFSLYSVAPVSATDTPSPIEAELESTLQGIIASCKSTSDSDACILDKIDKKRRLYESFLDKTAPAAWPDIDIISFIFFHVAKQIGNEQVRCSALEAPAKQSCVDQIPTIASDAREEARHLLIAKGEAYGKRQGAEQAARDRRLQQEYAEAQREQEMELARIQALGLILGNGGLLRPVPPMPTYQPQPIPTPVVPSYQPNRVSPPISCTSQQAGSMTYTNCY